MVTICGCVQSVQHNAKAVEAAPAKAQAQPDELAQLLTAPASPMVREPTATKLQPAKTKGAQQMAATSVVQAGSASPSPEPSRATTPEPHAAVRGTHAQAAHAPAVPAAARGPRPVGRQERIADKRSSSARLSRLIQEAGARVPAPVQPRGRPSVPAAVNRASPPPRRASAPGTPPGRVVARTPPVRAAQQALRATGGENAPRSAVPSRTPTSGVALIARRSPGTGGIAPSVSKQAQKSVGAATQALPGQKLHKRTASPAPARVHCTPPRPPILAEESRRRGAGASLPSSPAVATTSAVRAKPPAENPAPSAGGTSQSADAACSQISLQVRPLRILMVAHVTDFVLSNVAK